MQASGHAGEDRATLRFRFTANGDNKCKELIAFENIEHCLRLVSRNVDPDFSQRFDGQRIQRAWFEAGAVRFKVFPADLVEQRRRHLATRAVVHANKKNLFLHRPLGSRKARKRVKDFRVTIT